MPDGCGARRGTGHLGIGLHQALRLRGGGAELTGIGDRWEQVAAAFAAAAQAGHPADLLKTATEPMHEIAGLEQDFWECLSAMSAA